MSDNDTNANDGVRTKHETSASRFVAFISYRHQQSSTFAENLELALKSYAKPLWQRPMAIFRDEKYLAPGKPLDAMIRSALLESRYMIYLASPEAAESQWVDDELDMWCREFRRTEELIIVLSKGTIAYDPLTKRLDWSRTDCLPKVLETIIDKVPLFVDARSFVAAETQSLGNAEFRRAVNQIVARLRAIDPIEMSGLEMKQHRRNLLVRNALFSAIAASSIAFAGAAFVAEINRREALEQTRQAERRESELLASASRTARLRGDYRLALKQALSGLPTDLQVPERPLVAETNGALIEAVNANRLLYSVEDANAWSRSAAISPDGNMFVYGTDVGDVALWRFHPGPVEIGRLHLDGWISAVAFSNNGSKVIAASLDGDVAIMMPSRKETELFRTGLRIEVVAFSNDGHSFALGTRDGIVQVRDAATGKVENEPSPAGDMIEAIFFSSDDTRLLTAGHDGRARLWDLGTDSEALIFNDPENKKPDWIIAADLDPTGTVLATASLDRRATLWTMKNGTPLARLEHALAIDDIRFDHSGKRVITASRDRTAKVWSVPGGEELATFAHVQDVGVAAFLPDGKHAVTGSSDGAVRLWDIESNEEVAVLGRHRDRDTVSTMTVAPGGDYVLSTSSGGEVRLWRVRPETAAWTLGHYEAVNDIFFSPDGTRLLSSSEDYTCRVWSLETSEVLFVIEGGETAQSWCRWDRDGEGTIFSPFDAKGSLQVQSVSVGGWSVDFELHGAPVNAVSLDPKGKSVVTADLNGRVRLWPNGPDGEGEPLGMLPDWVLDLVVDTEKQRVLAASADGTIAMWRLEPPYSQREIPWEKAKLGRISLSPDGQRLAIVTSAGSVQLFDLDSMESLGGFDAGDAARSAIAFSPDGKVIAVAGAGGVLWLWQAGKPARAFSGHTDWISALSFDTKGTRLATASSDGTVRLWRTADGHELAVLRGHDARVTAVDFAPDGRWLASSAQDGSIHVWRIERTLAELYEVARQMSER